MHTRTPGPVGFALAASLIMLGSACASAPRAAKPDLPVVRPAQTVPDTTSVAGAPVDGLETVIGKIRHLSAKARPVAKHISGTTIEGSDPRLAAAARVLGASRGQAFREVTLPLLAPAIGAAALLVFIFDFTSFGVVLVLGGPRFATLETEIYRQTIHLFNLPVAVVLALVQLLCTLALTAVYARLSRQAAVPLNLRAARDTRRPLQTLGERLGASAMVAVLVGLLLTPMLALALRSVARLEAERGQSGPVQPLQHSA